jgi:hypothetical protein
MPEACIFEAHQPREFTMTDAARLRAQKAHSTDPEYLERMALAEEERDTRMPSEQIEKAPAAEDAGTGE